ncbi:MAG: hypothetical protein OEX12_10650 [Gammaproteobacteria bacterium]|nr:hypothetical protein [Gammaproteobacteria bacterium]
MKDIIFLFGAGASYGCGGVIPEQPPLGSCLYPALKENYPASWGSLSPHIVKKISSDFEQGMKIIYDELGSAIPGLMRELAVYLIQFRSYNKSTLYNLLIADLNEAGILHKTLFSTLNYDCILEFCLAEMGHNISYFDDDHIDSVPVWKLHGSSNMFSHGVQAGQGVSYGTGVTFEGGVEAFLDSDRVIQKCLVETGLAPVMCLYMEGKILNVSPSIIKSLQDSWAERVLSASSVFCIGVRPMLGDSHIWDPISQTDASVYFVGNQSEIGEWIENNRVGTSTYLGNRFNTAYSSIRERINL